MLRDVPGQVGKKRRVHGNLIVEKMLEELKLQEATCKGMGDALPDKMCLTSEQMKLIEEKNLGLLGKLVAVFGKIEVSDVPLDGHWSVETK